MPRLFWEAWFPYFVCGFRRNHFKGILHFLQQIVKVDRREDESSATYHEFCTPGRKTQSIRSCPKSPQKQLTSCPQRKARIRFTRNKGNSQDYLKYSQGNSPFTAQCPKSLFVLPKALALKGGDGSAHRLLEVTCEPTPPNGVDGVRGTSIKPRSQLVCRVPNMSGMPMPRIKDTPAQPLDPSLGPKSGVAAGL